MPPKPVRVERIVAEFEKTIHNPIMKLIRDDPKQTKLIEALFAHRQSLMGLYKELGG